MRRLIERMFILLLLVYVLLQNGLYAEDEKDTGIKQRGVVFDIAEDRIVNKSGGIYEPEGLDKYMKRRFDALATQTDNLIDRIDSVDERLKSIESILDQMSLSQKENVNK